MSTNRSRPQTPGSPFDHDKAPLHHLTRYDKKKYSYNVKRYIQLVYVIMTIVWVLLIYFLRLYREGPIGWLIILVPFIVFGISYYNIGSQTTDIESEMFQGNFLSFAFLIVSILVNWKNSPNVSAYYRILLVALLFLVFSLIDVWIKTNYLILFKHIRSIFQTISLTLLAFVFFMFYHDVISGNLSKSEPVI